MYVGYIIILQSLCESVNQLPGATAVEVRDALLDIIRFVVVVELMLNVLRCHLTY